MVSLPYLQVQVRSNPPCQGNHVISLDGCDWLAQAVSVKAALENAQASFQAWSNNDMYRRVDTSLSFSGMRREVQGQENFPFGLEAAWE